MKRKIFSILTSLILCVWMMPISLMATAEDATSPFAGSGTQEDPYQISTAYELRLLSELIASEDTTFAETYANASYIQTVDIDLNNEKFTPIGKHPGVGFYGTYNGNYHSIDNLLISEARSYVGLFGWLKGGNIINLSVYGDVSSTSSSNGYVIAGGIAGEVCDGARIQNCSFSGSVTATDKNVGGIAGQIARSGKVACCYFNGTVSGYNYIGGITGYISDQNNVGQLELISCYSTGELSSTSGETSIGGIAGKVVSGNDQSIITLVNNYYLNTTCSGGVNGDSYMGCTKLVSTALKACSDMLGSPFVDNNETDGFNDGYPIFEWQSTPYQFKGSGTAEDPYQISSKDELKKMRDLINSTYFGKDYYYCTYLQTADIDLENEQWTPIGKRMKDGVDGALPAFMGNYNGGYHSIYNLNVNETEKFAGLFGSFGNTGTIKNLTVYGTVKSTAASVGGICGEMCAGNTTIKNCAFIGDVTGGDFGVGGIVGMAWQSAGVVEGCYHNGAVTNTTDVNSAGGIIGSATLDKEGKIEVKNSYHVGQVVGAENVSGGIIGNVKNTSEGNISIINCYYRAGDASVGNNGTCTEATVYDLTSNLLKKSAEDLGSPFVTSTSDSLNDGYPVFAWQLDTWGKGDINLDGQVSVADAVYLQGYLLCRFSFNETEWHAADLIDDGSVDAFDMVIMRKILIYG